MTRKAQRPWTGQELARLAELRRRGLPIKAIARCLGRGQQSVSYALRHHQPAGLRGYTRPADGDILTLHRQGLPGSEIGRRLGCNRSTVRRRLRAMGLRANGHNRESRLRAGRAGFATLEARHLCRWHLQQEKATAMGWPEARTPLQARVCQALLDRGGPMRWVEIRAAVQGSTGFLLSELMVWGVVVRLKRGLYDLAPWVRARRNEERGGAAC